ncbi:MAG: hypothetical protein RL430_1551 [Actinomycetota bacterium]
MKIIGYAYLAAIYCPGCIVAAVNGTATRQGSFAEQDLDALARERGIDRMDEHTFDSDDFPKVIFSTQVEDDEHCEKCGGAL